MTIVGCLAGKGNPSGLELEHSIFQSVPFFENDTVRDPRYVNMVNNAMEGGKVNWLKLLTEPSVPGKGEMGKLMAGFRYQ